MWVDGHAIGSHRGSYLPFELRDRLAAGTHTLVVRVDWRDPAAQAQDGFHRTWFNWGGLDGEVDVRAIGPSELCEPDDPDDPLAGDSELGEHRQRHDVAWCHDQPGRPEHPRPAARPRP